MSCIMHGDQTFKTLAAILARDPHQRNRDEQYEPLAYIARPLLPGQYVTAEDHAHAIALDWYKANRLAYVSRYAHHKDAAEGLPEEPAAFTVERLASDDLIAFISCLKLMESVRYQCNEDVPRKLADWQDGIMEEMRRATGALALAIIHKLPQYDKANWI